MSITKTDTVTPIAVRCHPTGFHLLVHAKDGAATFDTLSREELTDILAELATARSVKRWYDELLDVVYADVPEGINDRPDPRLVVQGLRAELEAARGLIGEMNTAILVSAWHETDLTRRIRAAANVSTVKESPEAKAMRRMGSALAAASDPDGDREEEAAI